MNRVYFEQYVRTREGKELFEWNEYLSDLDLALLQAQGPLLRSGGAKVHIVKVEKIEAVA